MNRYRVKVTTSTVFGRSTRAYDVDASTVSVAARRALEGLRDRDEVSVTIKLIGRNIVRERVERLSHGRARAVT